MDCRRLGAIALKAPIIMPMDDGFAKPQTAKVAIDALLAYKKDEECFYSCIEIIL